MKIQNTELFTRFTKLKQVTEKTENFVPFVLSVFRKSY